MSDEIIETILNKLEEDLRRHFNNYEDQIKSLKNQLEFYESRDTDPDPAHLPASQHDNARAEGYRQD